MSKYLITGGCGFVGSNLAAEVLRRGEELYVIDNLYRFGSDANGFAQRASLSTIQLILVIRMMLRRLSRKYNLIIYSIWLVRWR